MPSMAFTAPRKHLRLLLSLQLCFLAWPSSSDPRATEAAIVCLNNTASLPQRQAFVSSFIDALNSLTPLVAFQGYGSVVNSSGNLSVYAFSQCFKDLSTTDCDLCFSKIKTQIQQCLPYQRLTLGGRLFFDGCYLRYDNHAFYDQILTLEDRTVCGSSHFGGNQTIFQANVVDLVKNLSLKAVNNSGFLDASVSRRNVTVYGLAQCWEFVNRSACSACLADAASRISSCPSKVEGRVLNAGCYMRYSTQKFYNNSATPALPPLGRSGSPVIIATILSALACITLVAGAVFIGREKLKRAKENKRLRALLSTVHCSKLNFSYEILEEATDYFHDSNKLGQGGSGSVYKGKLPDGTVIAVKRLFFSTRQWVDHFFNEINLISSIRHKNLVKLLGCSITGPESLLVYEFVPNQSLHDHIFVKRNVRPLSWEERYKIIQGTAEGLAHLHEESNLRIIHRDIKLSNILLDLDFTPKIADFGLVRLLPEDKSHLSTAIAGTLGYMAPEYVVCGVLTEKADVYSFGVLMIEVISGKKNNSFPEGEICMLHMIWSLYVRGKVCEAVDRALEGKFREEEASHLLQIGLLCVQANAELRPSMSQVVQMLINTDHQLPKPTQPPFLNSSSAEITRSIQLESASSRSYLLSNSDDNSVSESLIDPRQTYSAANDEFRSL